MALGISKISIELFSIAVLISFGLASNQAFAGAGPGFISCGSNADCAFLTNECAVWLCDAVCVFSETGTFQQFGRGILGQGAPCEQGDVCTTGGICGGPVFSSGKGLCEGNEPISSPQCNAVGGELIPVETTSLILAGTQSTFSWMIPITVSAIGIAIVVARKFSKYQPD